MDKECKKKKKGSISVSVEEAARNADVVKFRIHASKVDKKDLFGALNIEHEGGEERAHAVLTQHAPFSTSICSPPPNTHTHSLSISVSLSLCRQVGPIPRHLAGGWREVDARAQDRGDQVDAQPNMVTL